MWQVPPAAQPLRRESRATIGALFESALARADGAAGAHCIHELWMRHEPPGTIERGLAQLWQHASASIPEWLPMRYIEWLPLLYQVGARFQAESGRSNIYLVLLDYADRRGDPYGLYVGMSRYAPARRFDQHKSGIRAAGSVLKRGLEVLTGPSWHLQHIARAQAVEIEQRLAQALRAEGLLVHGGH